MDAREPVEPIKNPITRWLAYIGLFLVAFVLYWASDLLFERYITTWLSWIIVGAMCVSALVILIVDESRRRDDDDLS